MLRFMILICFLVVEGLASSKCEDTMRYQTMLPDSFSNCEAMQGSLDIYADEIIGISKELKSEELKVGYLDDKKAEKMIEEFKRNLKDIERKKFVVPKVEIVDGAMFDDTGLICGNVKYFIRIWKHPPKEKFNMPTFKLR
ncbi:hypothetical protein [Candidatus Kryptobacter tengchongensis]|uniref:Uncharacterized protein n=1 Tax=Kryptobacter tengchongensis TaxID=1643429 RepID=A0A916LJK8_KRYT1|nr:hypothetical protein [Candidatus Kryptobacter tengchongensis]CUT01504.1 hypothetical protein JGI25_00903 [Candidatus Kryptobacter tengchongensis]